MKSKSLCGATCASNKEPCPIRNEGMKERQMEGPGEAAGGNDMGGEHRASREVRWKHGTMLQSQPRSHRRQKIRHSERRSEPGWSLLLWQQAGHACGMQCGPVHLSLPSTEKGKGSLWLTAALVFDASITASDSLPGLTWKAYEHTHTCRQPYWGSPLIWLGLDIPALLLPCLCFALSASAVWDR